MAEIRPFHGIRYNEAKATGSLGSVVAPPYDVISLEDQDRLYEKSPHNCIRLILNREYDGDGPKDNRYTRAAQCFEEWLNTGVLVEDLRPAYYICEQTYEIRDGSERKQFVRRGIMVAMKLEPFGTGCVIPHEETLPIREKDRFQLMRASRANFSSIFALVPDEEEELRNALNEIVEERTPETNITEDDGTNDKLWLIDDEDICARLTKIFAGKKIFIADGHQRYETACSYREERWKNDSSPGVKRVRNYDYILMMCVPLSEPGLHIMPTHRLIKKVPDFNKDAFFTKVSELFEVKAATDEDLLAIAGARDGQIRFGVVLANRDKRILIAKPEAEEALKQVAPSTSDVWRSLDVAMLRELVIKGTLGVGLLNGSGRNGIVFTRSARDVIETLPGSAAYDLGFIMRPTKIAQVCQVAEGGERMPPKSTYFYPKLPCGLVMRRL